MASNPFRVVLNDDQPAVKLVENENLHGYIAVSDVGRMAMGSSRSELPLLSSVVIPSWW